MNIPTLPIPRIPRASDRPTPGRLLLTLAFALLGLGASASAAETRIQSDHDAYYPGEPIRIAFTGGPGNAKDWIGVYPPEVEPGPTPSTAWRYVDNTADGNTGLTEGSILLPAGLALAGDWYAYFLLNDGYVKLATNVFQVVEPGTSLARVDKRIYQVGEAITVAFTNGYANAKDWIGIYRVGQVPGASTPSTLWSYVDGTRDGNTGLADGTVTFAAGLAEAGEWVVHFLYDDSYDILSSETFTVVASTTTTPRVLSLSPSNGATNVSPNLEFSASITNGTSQIVTSSLELRVDGALVTPTVLTENELIRVHWTAPALAAAGSEHTWVLTAQDNATPPNTLRAEVRGTVRPYRNLILTNPVVFENFDAVPEGSLPAGWSELGYSSPITESLDFGDLGSAAYRTWTAVDASRFNEGFVTYGNPETVSTDYRRVLSPNPDNVVNDSILSGPLAQGRFLFGNSGYQNGSASQVMYLFTPDFDLTGKTNIHLGFHSLWEQNQDSLAAVEYSINGGQSWLPIAYLLNAGDIITVSNEITGAITIDVEATFTTEYSDVARYVDELGNEIGGSYGAFIAAPISQDLAPFIQGRIDDNPVESKRVEWFRLPAADNQARVRFRFTHAGTDSWYFGIDNFGLYAPTDGSGPGESPTLEVTRAAGELVLSWPADAAGYVLESSASPAGGTWQAVTGVTGNSHRVAPSAAATFYRLRR
jgi:hypothetical protein